MNDKDYLTNNNDKNQAEKSDDSLNVAEGEATSADLNDKLIPDVYGPDPTWGGLYGDASNGTDVAEDFPYTGLGASIPMVPEVTDESAGDYGSASASDDGSEAKISFVEQSADATDASAGNDSEATYTPRHLATASKSNQESGANGDHKGATVPKLIRTSMAICIAAACALAGGAIGYLIARPSGADMAGKTSLSKNELDTVVGQVMFDGKSVDITAKQVIMLNGSLNGDKHDYPSADEVVTTARNIVMEADAEKRGITMDEKTMLAFMKDMVGSDDYESVASQYQIDVDSLKELVKSSYISQEIRKQVVGDQEPSMATPPEAPAEGKESEATKAYYDYIIKVAGDEWDAKKGKWKDKKGDFAVTLGESKTFDPKSKKATYDDALGAYQVVGSRYSAKASTYDTLWNDYMKQLLSGARISVYSLVS